MNLGHALSNLVEANKLVGGDVVRHLPACYCSLNLDHKCRYAQRIHRFPHTFVCTSVHALSPRLKERYHGNRSDILHSDIRERDSHIHRNHNMGLPKRTKEQKLS